MKISKEEEYKIAKSFIIELRQKYHAKETTALEMIAINNKIAILQLKCTNLKDKLIKRKIKMNKINLILFNFKQKENCKLNK